MAQNGGNSNNATTSAREVRIAIGSQNPAKIRAVQRALQQVIDNKEESSDDNGESSSSSSSKVVVVSTGYDVESGVRDQPMGDDETCLGAKNRAEAAYFAFRKKFGTAPHFAVGLEGGLEEFSLPQKKNGSSTTDSANGITPAAEKKQLYCMAWMAVYGKRTSMTVDLLASPQVQTYFGDRKPIFGCAKTGTFPIPPKVADLVEKGMELGYANDQVFQSRESKSGLGAVGLLTDGLIDRSAYYEHALVLALTPWIRPDMYP